MTQPSKKYLKITGKEVITADNQQRADAFSDWYVSHRLEVERQLKNKRAYDEDILHDIYLSIICRILYGGFVLEGNPMGYFMSAYYLLRLKTRIRNKRISCLEDSALESFQNQDISLDALDKYLKETNLYANILEYIQETYPESFKLFSSNMLANGTNKMSYEKLSEATGLSQRTIGIRIREIKESARHHQPFRNERQLMI